MSLVLRVAPSLLLAACTSPAPVAALVDPAVPAPPGTSRAGVVREGIPGEAALLSGISAEGGAGDIKLYNDRVQFIIQGPYRSHGYVDAGGSIIDMDLVPRGGALGNDGLEDLFFAFGIGRLFHADAVRVVADGLDGGPAIVEASGTDVDWTFIQGALDSEEPLVAPMGLAIKRTYTLAPDSNVLQLETELRNPGTEAVTAQARDGWIAAQEILRPWAAGRGHQGPTEGVAAAGWFGMAGEAAFSMWPETGTWDPLAIDALADSAGLVALGTGPIEIPAGGAVVQRRTLGLAADIATLEGIRKQVQGIDTEPVAGTVVDPAGDPIEGARIWAVQGDEAPTVEGPALSDSAGRWAIDLAAGLWSFYAVAEEPIEDVDLDAGIGRVGPFAAESANGAVLAAWAGTRTVPSTPWARGHLTLAPREVTVGAGGVGDVVLDVGDAGRLRVVVKDTVDRGLPATIEVLRTDARPVPLPDEPVRTALALPEEGAHAAWLWTIDGEITVALPPGSYEARVAHSFRHERHHGPTIDVLAGAESLLDVQLEEVVPRLGWVSLDSHLHGAPSNDGSLPMEDRLITCAANGVDVPVTTDHDRQGDYRPLASALGLSSRMFVVPGVEVSSTTRGHFNLFPIDPQPRTQNNGGAPDWWTPLASTEELFQRMRDAQPGAFAQVNHGRGTGMMDFASFDPNTGVPTRASYWSWDFDGFELINGGGARDWEAERRDWFAFLRAGHKKVPLGVSDSHSRTSDCGYGRTDLYVGSDDPGALTAEAVDAALRAGHVVVAGGVTLRVTVSDALPGDEVAAVDGQVVVGAQVSAPSWMPGGVLRVYLDGEVVFEREVPQGMVGGLQDTIIREVPVTQDGFIAVEFEGTQALDWNWGGSVPYAMTNAFLIDADGGGWAPLGP